MSDQELHFTFYDLNKQIISQLTPVEEAEAKETLSRYFSVQDNKYFMLLCRDINYYTVFVLKDGAECKVVDEVWACAKFVGVVKSVEIEDNVVEIWFTDNEDQTYVMYLFSYDDGVIECAL